MKARNLASPQVTLRNDEPAAHAAMALSRHDLRSILVVDRSGTFVGVLSDSELLRALLPPIVGESQTLARVLEESASDVLFERVEHLAVADLLPDPRETAPVVAGDDTLVEVADVMVRSRASLVGVIDDGRLVGGISIDDLISHLLKPR